MIRGSELILARRRLGALAKAIGVTPTGERYIPTWFSTKCVCHALDLQIAHMRGKSWGVRRVLLMQPTQTGKSFHAEELFSSAIAGHLPRARIVTAGYGSDFMADMLPNVRALSQTEGWRATFPHVRLGRADKRSRSADNTGRLDINEYRQGKWERTGGFILARSVRGAISGKQMDAGILGDPYKDWKSALSIADNRDLRNFYTGVFAARQQSRRSTMTVAFTPWTPTDVGVFIREQWEKEGEPYLVLKFPMFQRPDSAKELERWRASPALRAGLARYLDVDEQALNQVVEEHGLRPYDLREDGYPLLPYKDRDEEFYAQRARSMPARDFAAMAQLDPTASIFERFPRSAWRTFDPEFYTPDHVVFSLDPNAKATDDGSFAALGVYGLTPVKVTAEGKLDDPDPLLLPVAYEERQKRLSVVRQDMPALPWKLHRLDEARDRPNYSELLNMIARTFEKWPEGSHLVLEEKAAGLTLMGDVNFTNLCRAHDVTVIPVSPSDHKDDRTARAEPPVRNGYCFIPGKTSERNPRVTTHWLHDDPDRTENGEGIGWLKEMAEHCQWDDRPDEFAQLVGVLNDPESRHLFDSWAHLAQFG